MAEKNTPEENRAFNSQLYASVATGLGLTALLYAHSFPTFGVPSMERDVDFAITPQQSVLMGAIVPIASIMGNFLAAMLVDTIGRRNTMITGSCFILIAHPLMALTTTISQALISRAMCGVGGSLLMLGIIIYISEVVEPRYRDRLGSFGGAMLNMGMLLAFGTGSQVEWRTQAWIGVVTVLPMMIMLTKLHKSPLFLVKKGSIKDAVASLAWYRTPSQAKKELKFLEEDANKSETNLSPNALRDFVSPPYIKPLITVVLLLTAQHLSGVAAITQYAVEIFELLGVSVQPALCTVLIAVVNIITTIVGAEVHIRYNRKPVLVTATSLFVALQLFLGVFFWARVRGDDTLKAWTDSGSSLALAAVLLLFVTFGMGIGSIPIMYMGEGLPTKIKGIGAAIGITCNMLTLFVVLVTFKPMVGAFGYHGTFFFFAVGTAVIVSVGHSLMKETRGKSVTEIDDYYNLLVKTRENKKKNT